MAVGMIVVVAAGVQFTRWKARHLACCREPRVTRAASASAAGAWGFGVRLGWHCLNSSAALTVALLAVGMMDLRTMAAATGAITAERLTPPHARVTWIVGGIGGCIGIALAARAALA
jgi:predicted metal-binding membrane protein